MPMHLPMHDQAFDHGLPGPQKFKEQNIRKITAKSQLILHYTPHTFAAKLLHGF